MPAAHGAVTVGHSGWSWGSPSPQGQTIRAIEFAGARGYAAGAFGTVLVTDDSGVTWTGAATGITQSVDRVDIVDHDSVVISGGCHVRRSDDGGQTFARLPWTASDARCPAGVVAPDFLADETGYLLLDDGSVLRTTDGGRTWARRTAVPGTRAAGEMFAPTDAAFTTPTEGVAATAQGRLYRTTDGAQSWTLVRETGPAVRDVHFISPMSGFAAGDGGLLRTLDGGATWLQLASGPLRLSTIRCADGFTCIATTQSGQSLMRTTDGGVTLTPVSPSSEKLLAVAFGTEARAVAAGEDGATVRSQDAGATWAPVGARLSQAFSRIRAVSASLVFAVGLNGTLARSSDGGLTWSELGVSTSEDLIDVSFADSFVGYAVDAAGTVLRTDNGGVSWQILNTGYRATPQAVLALGRNTVLLIGGRGILRSTDGGDSFTRIRARIVAAARLFNVDRTARRVFAYGSKNIVASSNGGRTWKKVLRPRKALLASLHFVSARTGFVLGQDGRLFKTRSGGRRWSDLSAVGSDDATGMSFGSARRGYLTLKRFGDDTSGYLLRTTDGGRSWRPQLVSSETPSAEGLVAMGSDDAFLLADSSLLLFTTSGGDHGETSKVTLRTTRRTVRRRTVIRLGGRVRGARGGARVLVARRERGESGWVHQDATVASNGTFTTRWRLRKTAAFVAQWAGDEDSAGDGSPALVVRVKRR
ncbi:MAG: WD40/YVTN/BNR-like repeat-containing protein [Solirubrobacterales bacterium]